MTVSDNTIEAEGLGSFFENLGKISAKAVKKLATNALKNPGKLLEIGANVATGAASRNLEATLSKLPEVIIFYHTGKGVYLPGFVSLYPTVCLILYHLSGAKSIKIISLSTVRKG